MGKTEFNSHYFLHPATEPNPPTPIANPPANPGCSGNHRCVANIFASSI